MIGGRRVCVVMPAYNAEKTLRRTVAEIDRAVADDVILVDDQSNDQTVGVARELGLHVVVHEKNRGYGGNQKTCYTEALRRGADIVVMIHPDYQYSPRLMPAMAGMIASGHFDVVLGSRVLGVGALAGGMPIWKYCCSGTNWRSTTPAIAPFLAASSRRCRSRRIPTTSFSTIKCSRRPSGSGSTSARSAAPRAILPKRRRSVSAAA